MAEERTWSAEEQIALGALKAKINDPHLPTLDLARALETHLTHCPQTQRELAAKLGMPQKRSYLTQVMRLAKRPLEIQKSLEGRVLGPREIRRLQPNDTADDNSDNQGDNQGDNQTDNQDQGVSVTDNQPINAKKRVNQGDNQTDNQDQGVRVIDNQPINAKKRVNQGDNQTDNQDQPVYPLLRDTINVPARILLFWVRDVQLGGLAERWVIRIRQTSWLRSLVSVTYFGLAVLGAWRLQQVARPRIRQLWAVVRGAPSSRLQGPGARLDSPLTSAGNDGKGVAVPQLTGERLISGNRMELRWAPGAPGTAYQVYWNSPQGDEINPIGGVLNAPGAIVEIQYEDFRLHGFLTVVAIAPDNTASAPSVPVAYDPTPLNWHDDVQPLPFTADTGTRGHGDAGTQGNGDAAQQTFSASPRHRVPASLSPAVRPPAEVHADVKTPDLIRLSWRAVAKDVHYNVYSSGSRDLTALRKENDHPLTSNQVDWTPETGLERYWIVVTTLDAQGRESAYSEAIEVVRHPEKSGPDLTDQAAGALRKVLPW